MTAVRTQWQEFRLLFLTQILEQRTDWPAMVVFTTFFPLVMVFGLGFVGSGQTHAGLAYVITGSTVVSLTTIGITMIAQETAFMKEQGVFLYYASLPIAKSSLLLAMLASRLLLQLPGIAVALVGGSFLYHFPLSPDPAYLLILPLTALALSGIGAAMGLLVPSVQLVNVLSQVALFVVFFGAPVLIPAARLPLPLQWFGALLPPSYAADALRHAVAGSNDARLALDLGVLLAAAALSLWGVGRGLKWRLR
jgi:ABC-2 type transport system permease protein